MKKSINVLCVVFTLLVLSACKPIQVDNGMIDPGEKVGDFLFSTGNEEDTTYFVELNCQDQSEELMTCEANTGEKVNVSYALYNDKAGETLDDMWSEHTYKMVIGDQQVNLEPFGSIDAYHTNEFGTPFKMRHWNIWVMTDTPGEITIKHSGVVDGESFEGITVINFVAR